MSEQSAYRLWVNEERTVLVRAWLNDRGEIGKVETATRLSPDHTWGPPIYLDEERVS